MIYRIKMMSGKDIQIDGEEALRLLLTEANKGKKLILTKYGVVNASSIDSITEDKGAMDEIRHEMKLSGKSEQQAKESVMPPSPFAKLLAQKMAMLSPKSRTEAQEEAARDERRG